MSEINVGYEIVGRLCAFKVIVNFVFFSQHSQVRLYNNAIFADT